jgi:hypothetical protein
MTHGGGQAIHAYVDVLREVYGPEMVLDPVIISQAALSSYDDPGGCAVFTETYLYYCYGVCSASHPILSRCSMFLRFARTRDVGVVR